MPSSVAFLRGINVGGKNLIRMPDLAACFRDAGHRDVRTYIQSGNVLFTPDHAAGPELEDELERMLGERFHIPILVVVRSRDELAATIAAAPANHGSENLRSDVFFLKHPLTAEAAYAQMPELREGVDSVAPGPGSRYFARVAAQASKTRITRLMSMPVYRQMTVRSWRTRPRAYSRCSSAGADATTLPVSPSNSHRGRHRTHRYSTNPSHSYPKTTPELGKTKGSLDPAAQLLTQQHPIGTQPLKAECNRRKAREEEEP